ncbi:hypothetical protein [Pseudoalteromonas ruthenica]|uniref:hypothetical protein n=1 Tax=Pseudoalteromonas ruthenica TaxID=151081 RepID=UPI00034B1397|nr:hypothetical protein [Pseudoalteromonas ruthenica]
MLVKITNLDEALVNKVKEITGERTAAKAVSKIVHMYPNLTEELNYSKNKIKELESILGNKKMNEMKIKEAISVLMNV